MEIHTVMSTTFGRQEFDPHTASGRERPDAADWHVGDRNSFLRRHVAAADAAVRHGPQAIHALSSRLLQRIGDARNLHIAWDFLRQHGGQAPGPNGHRYHQFEVPELWNVVRCIGAAVRESTYRPGPARRVKILKGSGRGYRTLTLHNIEDRAVQRGIVQIIQPLIDPRFDERSSGFRPGRGRQLALAQALAFTVQQNRRVWLVEDLRDAFDHVPHQRLLDVLRRTLPEDVLQLIAHVIHNGGKHGLPQGSPLSPLLLNIYLDHFLDTPWRKLHPNLGCAGGDRGIS